MAKGSHTTLAGWEPKTCCWCGQPIVVSRQAVGYELNHLERKAYAWHLACGQGPKR